MSNPTLEVCLDYNSEPNEPLQLTIIDRFELDEQQAVTCLNEIWEQDRAHQVVAWDQQRAEQQCTDKQVQQEERAEEEECIRLEQDEAEKERKEAEKKKPKINDFDSDLPPSIIIPCPSQYAIQKITSFKFVEMWYFSPDGCSEATHNHCSQADDTLGLSATNDIPTLRPITLVKALKNACQDYKLSFSEFLQAKNSYLHHIKQISWLDKHINALAEFFWNLENHPAHSNPNGDLVALHYAA